MRTSKLRTMWIAFLSIAVTAYTSCKAIIKSQTGKIERPWVDAMIHRWVERLLRLARVQCKVFNPHQTEPQPGVATIVMCNHTSIYDIPISFLAFPHHSLRMLAKKELSKIPLLGKGMLAAEFSFIDRHNRHQAIKDLAVVKQLMESGIVMWIAPEGTRSKNGKLAPFKKGAFITAIEAKATIIPIGIRGAFEILPAKTMHFNLGQTAEIHIGQSIDASQYTLDNKEELVQKVHQAVKVLVGEENVH